MQSLKRVFSVPDRRRERRVDCRLQGAELMLLLLGEMPKQGMHWLRPGKRTIHDRCRQLYTPQKCFLSVIRWATAKTWLTNWSPCATAMPFCTWKSG